MLDLLISFINYLIISIRSFLRNFIFYPPNPKGYRLEKNITNKDKEEITFLQNSNLKELKYKKENYNLINYKYIKIPDKENNSYIPLLKIEPKNPFKICIIYSHGNSADIGTSLQECVDLSLNTNSSILSYDYPSFGLCKNKPLNEENVYYNMKKTYEYAKNVLKYNSNQIILYGFSLGTGISFHLACNKNFPIAGCILQAPFLSILRIRYYLNQTYFFDYFNSCDKANNLCSPLMIIHGNKDTIVPYIHGRILAKLVPKNFLFEFVHIKGAGHNNIFKNEKEYIYKKIRNFLEYCTKINFNENNNINGINMNNNSNNKNENKNEGIYNMNNILNDITSHRSNINFDNLRNFNIHPINYRYKSYDEIQKINIQEFKNNLSNYITKSHDNIPCVTKNYEKICHINKKEKNNEKLKNNILNNNNNDQIIHESSISIKINEQKNQSNISSKNN
jgi:pimeloyl-ACP methyl ester carboxylesterase